MGISLSNDLIGKTISVDIAGDGRKAPVKRDYVIVGVYPHYVMACYTTKFGDVFRECFSVGDLVQMGLIKGKGNLYD